MCLRVEKGHRIQATHASFFGGQKAKLSCHQLRRVAARHWAGTCIMVLDGLAMLEFFFFFFWIRGNLTSPESALCGLRWGSKTPAVPGSYKRCTPWLELKTCCADPKPFAITLRPLGLGFFLPSSFLSHGLGMYTKQAKNEMCPFILFLFQLHPLFFFFNNIWLFLIFLINFLFNVIHLN
jgi:hypothetical protein